MSNLKAQLDLEKPVEVPRDITNNMEVLKPNNEPQAARPQPISAQVAREANKNLLNSLFKFKPGEPLGKYISFKTSQNKPLYSLGEVLTVLKDVIRGEGMFDEFNPSIILCDPALEEALGMKALHVTEIRDLVLKQLEKVSDPPPPPPTNLCTSTTPTTSLCPPSNSSLFAQETKTALSNLSRSLSNPSATPTSSLTPPTSSVTPPTSIPILPTSTASQLPLSSISQTSSIQPRSAQATMTARQQSCNPRPSVIGAHIYNNPSARFILKKDFQPVIRSVPGVDPRQTTFSYEQVTLLLSKYILARKATMFDQRNIKVALVADDPLGKAFNVKAFHRCQVTNFLRSQLVHVEDSTTSGVSSTSEDPANPQGAPSTVQVPPFPVLEKSQSLPAHRNRTSIEQLRSPSTSSGVVRKRSLSPEQVVKRSRENAPHQFSVVVRKANDSEESETETICSAQGYETAAADPDEAIVVERVDRVDSTENGNDDGDTDTDMEDEKAEDWRTAVVYSVEYDVESSSEDERRPNMAGGGADSDSEKDSDIEDDYRVAAGAVAVMADAMGSDSDYLGDYDSEEEEEAKSGQKVLDMVDPELEASDSWRCAQCDTPNTPLIRFCGKCWNIRKGWMPDRPKPKKKNRSAISSPRKGLAAWGANRKALDRSLSDPGQGLDEADSGVVGEILTVSDDEKSKDAIAEETSTDSGVGSQESLSSGAGSQESLEAGCSQDLSSESGCSVTSGGNKCDDVMSTTSSHDLDSEFSDHHKESNRESNLCMFCLNRPKDASFIHGRLGHQVCCYQCAKKYWNKSVRCPVCRRKIERIVRNIIQ